MVKHAREKALVLTSSTLLATVLAVWSRVRLLEKPHFVAPVGQFEGAVVACSVVGLLFERQPVSLQALHQLQQLLSALLLVGEAPVRPHKHGVLLPVLNEHFQVGGLGWVGLVLLWDVEGHSEVGLTGGASSRIYQASHRGSHLHLLLGLIAPLDVLEEALEASTESRIILQASHPGAHPLCCLISSDLIVLTLTLPKYEFG